MASQRKLFVGGNWKMNGTKASIDVIVENLNKTGVTDKTGAQDLHLWALHLRVCTRHAVSLSVP